MNHMSGVLETRYLGCLEDGAHHDAYDVWVHVLWDEFGNETTSGG